MFKKLLLSVVVIFGLGVAGVLYVTRDIGPSHPTLKAADLPALIPTRAFHADPNAAWDYVASPDGAYVAYRRSTLQGRSVAVRTVATGEDIAEFPIGLSFIRWHPTKFSLRFIYERQDWEVDLQTPDRKNWRRISPVRLSGGWVKNEIAVDQDMPILTWGKSSNRGLGHMWLVSQDGLKAKKVAEGTIDTRFWVFDSEKNPVLRLDSLDPATERLMRKTDAGWEKLVDISLNDIFQPVTNVRLDGTLLARSSRGRDGVALVVFDTRTGEEEVQIERDGDIALWTTLTTKNEPDVLRLGTDTYERVALTERGEVFLDVLAEFPQPVTLGATNPTASGRYVTQSISAQSTSWQHLLIDLQEGSYEVLSEDSLRHYKDDFVQGEAVRFVARDGVEIPGVLTRPKGATGPVPFIVNVHGGPAEHVALGLNQMTQLITNRGYGVLSVNFRGSTGFGKAFQAKGFRQFGRAMQNDISDAARWLVAEGLADPDALVVLGQSYGGYAAAMAMTQEPELFTAGVATFPMLDVEFQSKHPPGSWESGLDLWVRYFGDVDVPEDLAQMRKYSPINRVAQLHGPLLVLGGERDQITAIQQVRNFEVKARAAGKDVRVHYFTKAGHGVRHWRDQLRLSRLLEDFLAAEVGGRSGGFELVEWAPEFID